MVEEQILQFVFDPSIVKEQILWFVFDILGTNKFAFLRSFDSWGTNTYIHFSSLQSKKNLSSFLFCLHSQCSISKAFVPLCVGTTTPVVSTLSDVFVAPGCVHTTVAWAAPGLAYTTETWAVNVCVYTQEPELHLAVSTLQRPLQQRDVSIQHVPELHLDLSENRSMYWFLTCQH